MRSMRGQASTLPRWLVAATHKGLGVGKLTAGISQHLGAVKVSNGLRWPAGVVHSC